MAQVTNNSSASANSRRGVPWILVLIAGIILLSTDGWFSGQHTVGLILTIASSIVLGFFLLILIIVGIVAWIAHK